jgi:hypothetical protein
MTMTDPLTTGIAALVASHALKDSCARLLGPTADYLGGELRQFSEKQMTRFRLIASAGERKSGSRLYTPGMVNERVFTRIIDDGCFCTDRLSADYYGGFLASSRTTDGADDANISYVTLINRMSSDQLRAHWILYATLFNKMHGRRDFRSAFGLWSHEHRKSAAIYIPWRSFLFLFIALRTDLIDNTEPQFTFSGSCGLYSITIDERFLDDPRYYDRCLDTRRLDVVFWGY